MSGTVMPKTYNYMNCNIVPVIASFDTKGIMKPLYVRIEDESYKVVSSVLECQYALSTYRCQLENHGKLTPLRLTYHPSEAVWTMPVL